MGEDLDEGRKLKLNLALKLLLNEKTGMRLIDVR